jgi:GT2 family glycosyltransferase
VRLSFVVMTVDREALLRRCLDSLAGPPPGVEVLVVFNGSPAVMRERVARDYPWTRALALARCSLGEGRNRGARAAEGSILLFLDDDTFASAGFAGRVLDAFERFPDAPCIGGPNLAPGNSGAFQRASDFLLRSPLGAGPMRVRYRSGGADRPVPGWALMLCNLGVRREVFERHGLSFPERCASAEENMLMSRVEKRVGPVVLSPGLFVYHERRADLVSLWCQVLRCGRGRGHITRLDPTTLKPAALAAPLWLIYVCALPWLRLLPLGTAPLAVYLAAIAGETARLLVAERDPAAALLFPALVPLCHAAYALGFIDGLLRKHA